MKDPSSFFSGPFQDYVWEQHQLGLVFTNEQTVNTHREEKLNTNNNYETDFVFRYKRI